MERNNETQHKKRTRDDDDHDDGYENIESGAHKSKKLPAESVVESNSLCNNSNINNTDRIGVFDFPWLKEGVGFKADDYFEPEGKFSYYDLDHFDESSCVDNELFVGDGNLQENDYEKDGFNWLLKVDDLEPVDNCIWSFVIDQPLTIGLINKV